MATTISFILEVATRYLDDRVIPRVDAVIDKLVSSPDASVMGDDDDSIPDLIPGDQDLDESTAHTDRAATQGTRAQTPHVLRHRARNDQREAVSEEFRNPITLNSGMHVLLGILLGQLDHPFLIFFAVLGIVAVEHHATAYDNVLLEQYLASERKPGLLFASRYAPFAAQSQILDRMRRKQSGGRRETPEIQNLSGAMNSALSHHVQRAGGAVVREMEAQDQAGQNEASVEDVGGMSEIKIETIDEEDEEDEEDYELVEGTSRA